MNHKPLNSLHHIAIQARDIDRAIPWYTCRLDSELNYQNATRALLKFAIIHLAHVSPEPHPAYIGLTDTNAADDGSLTLHGDDTQCIYIQDSEDNHVEIMQS